MPKSFKRKYIKLCENYDSLIEKSENLQLQIEKAKVIANRISSENTHLMDLLLDQENVYINSLASSELESAAESNTETDSLKNYNTESDISSYYRNGTPPHLLSLSPHWDYSPVEIIEKDEKKEDHSQSILSTNSLFLSEKKGKKGSD
ncbi:hypothetical protein T552_02009 [Pneumocystis carinii B80]|uniref:INO80 complex subunit 3 N-terminal domain-containing protein n=1 Tax=Pneumocystis carinii (strain B80) TaxID=1408658 RepID=A0A0W4ZIE8_PNEC8|nr:hypothetical protein T552_02009 [Pneumocystis carinii B80]KTW28150.1 hypothetical protein T552_02009 [Pneumocystis carinii B80]